MSGRAAGKRRQVPRSSVTIQDVADRAGVSTATVSRALMTPDRVRAETREQVLQAVAATGYTPNRAARSLRARKAMMAMVIVPNVGNPFFSEVLRGIDAALSENGYGLIIGNLDNSHARERHFVDLAFAGQVDGVLLMNGWMPVKDDRQLQDAGVPIVSVGTNVIETEVPMIIVQNREASEEIACHLTGLGHRRLGYISGPLGNWVDAQRWQGYREGAAATGLDPDSIVRWGGRFDFRAGSAAGAAFLAMAPAQRPTGVFAASDEIAIGFLKVVRSAGVRVPEDVSVVGFDGIEYADYCEPTLTTVHQPRHELGRAGAMVLLRMLDQPAWQPPMRTDLKAKLIVRDSTGPAPAAAGSADRR
ncbi:MAG: LacI family DNA-binding transcriptional regulator [Alphaproteobacteria bacterium]